MKSPLGWIAVGGFLISAVCLSAAAALSDDWKRIPWASFHDDDERSGPRDETIIDRTLAWEAGEELNINVPAEVVFTDAPETKIVAHGPAWMVNRLEMDSDRLRMDGRKRRFHGDHLTVTISAPNVRIFSVNGVGKLTLKNLEGESFSLDVNGAGDVEMENAKVKELSIDISGAGDVDASGEVDAVTLNISGAGDGNLAGLKARSAKIRISGFGQVTAAPTEEADVAISGAGNVKLLTRPPRLRTRISGAGNISQADEDEIARPSAAPASARPN